MTLNDIRTEMQRTGAPANWSHSKIFEDAVVAHDEGVKITVFWDEWGERDQAIAIARRRATKTMEAWEHHLHEKEMRRQSSRRKS